MKEINKLRLMAFFAIISLVSIGFASAVTLDENTYCDHVVGSGIHGVQASGIDCDGVAATFGGNFTQNNTWLDCGNKLITASSGGAANGLIISNSFTNVSIYNCRISNFAGYQLWFINANNTRIADSILSGSATHLGLVNSKNITLINVSFTSQSVDINSNYTRQWYLDVQVNWSNGSAIGGANVNAFNATNIANFSGTTDSNGKFRLNVTQYVQVGATVYDFSIYNVSASEGSSTNGTIVAMRNNNQTQIILQLASSTPSYLNITLNNPSTSINATQYQFFIFNVTVRCTGILGCGNVNVTLDPSLVSGANDLNNEQKETLGILGWLKRVFGTITGYVVGGAVNTTKGGLPFYTNSSNPLNSTHFACLGSMADGTNCSVYWWVNATNNTGTYDFYVIANASIGNGSISSHLNVSIIQADFAAPNVTITSPTATTYSVDSYNVNITIDENGTCTFSVDNGATNESLTNTINRIFTGTKTSVSDAAYTLHAYCNDSSGNRNDSVSVAFTISTVSPVPPCPDCGGGGCTVHTWTYGAWGTCTNGFESRTGISNCNTVKTETRVCCFDSSWNCSAWGACSGGQETRSCTSNCGNIKTESRDCACAPVWQCTPFSQCSGGEMTRTCTDLNNCGLESGKPNEHLVCGSALPGAAGGGSCNSNYLCGNWSECIYNDKTTDIIKGKVSYTGFKEKVCRDLSACGESYSEYENCSSDVQINLVKGNICDEETLSAIDLKTGEAVTNIDVELWKANQLDVSFVQGAAIYCPSCYDGVKDGNEEQTDCGGKCRACGKESTFPIWILMLIFLMLSLVLLLLIIKLPRDRDNIIIAKIRKLIRKGESALRNKERRKAATIYMQTRWLYVQLESEKRKKMIKKEIHRYSLKIRKFYDF